MSRKQPLFVRQHQLDPIGDGIWRIKPVGKMRVGVNLICSQKIIERTKNDRSIDQAVNVATLPGVIDPVLTMPDIHQGYGFPIGGVAGFRLKNGVISPGGVGYDINCGVRLLKTPLMLEEVNHRETLKNLVANLFLNIPCGVGSKRKDLSFSNRELEKVLSKGARWATQKGFGTKADCDAIEAHGCIPGANPDAVSPRAIERGYNQLGTLGSGNHFVEIQYVDQIYDPDISEPFGLFPNQIVVMIHTGSRGLGYQVCSDYIETCRQGAKKHGIELVDKELAAVPINSREGQDYFQAMAGAANFAFANRQLITHWIRDIFFKTFGTDNLELLYDVCHNIAKIEEVPLGRQNIQVCIHRKGATRAYPPGHPEVPPQYRDVGQPVLVPGDMGRSSFILAGGKQSMKQSLGSACHGAGRELSRSQAKKLGKGRPIVRELEDKGIYVKAAGRHTVIEEMPEAYKDVTDVVQATENAKIATIVARLRPIGVIKG